MERVSAEGGEAPRQGKLKNMQGVRVGEQRKGQSKVK